MKFGSLAGPLGSYRNYITYIALSNFSDYELLKQENMENGRTSASDRFKEVRFYLNAAESFNNILDYFYYENESSLMHKNINDFRSGVHKKYPDLDAIANIANAYKHCVRENKKGKNSRLPWAKDLQKPIIHVDINIPNQTTELTFSFVWPIQENEEALTRAFQFWVGYIKNPFPDQILSA